MVIDRGPGRKRYPGGSPSSGYPAKSVLHGGLNAGGAGGGGGRAYGGEMEGFKAVKPQ